MKLVFALIIYFNGTLQPERTSFWIHIERCQYYANRLNNNTIINGKHVTAQCVPQWVDHTREQILK